MQMQKKECMDFLDGGNGLMDFEKVCTIGLIGIFLES
jgi:hypothetical protein